MPTTYTFTFPTFIKQEFLIKLAKLNKKLAKMKDSNQVEIVSEKLETLKVLKPEIHKRKKESRGQYMALNDDYINVVFSIVEVSLPVQNKIQGFELVGNIDIQGDVKTIFAINDSINLSQIETSVCHHCGTKRKRNAVTILKETSTDDIHVIGSTCVHDYLGIDIYPVLKTFFNFYKEEDFYESRGMRTAWGFATDELANAVRVAYYDDPTYVKADFGYNDNSTKAKVDRIYNIMYGVHTSSRQELFNILDKTQKVGKLLIDTYGDLDEKQNNFNSNLVQTLFYVDGNGNRILRDFIVGKARGIFIWACFNALTKQKKDSLPKESETPSFYIGEVGDKINIKGAIKFIKNCQTGFGSSRLVVVKSEDGAEVKTFSTSNSVWDLQVGDTVNIKGTISKHEEFKGTKSTLVKRAKFS